MTTPTRTEAGGFSAIVVIVSAVVNAWIAIAAYHFWISPPPRLGVVDVASVYREQEAAFTRMVTGDQVTDLDRLRALDRAEAFAKRLPVALEALSAECRCTLVPAHAVAARHRLTDYTEALRTSLAKEGP